jgi:hypothetical protein
MKSAFITVAFVALTLSVEGFIPPSSVSSTRGGGFTNEKSFCNTTGGSLSECIDDKKVGGIFCAISRGIKETKVVLDKSIELMTTLNTILGKTFAFVTALYGLSLVGYGSILPTQIRVLSIANAGGFNKVHRTVLALTKGAIGAMGTATLKSPSLAFATVAIADARKRRNLAIEYEKEHATAMENGIIDKKEYLKLKKLRRKQVRLEDRAIRRIKGGRNSLKRILHSANLSQLQSILGDTVLMFTAIMASRQPTVLGDFVYRYYIVLNMGSLFLEANKKIGYPLSRRVTKSFYIFDTDREELVVPISDETVSFLSPMTHFFLSKLPFPFSTYGKESEEVAAEEVAFVRSVGAIIAYTTSAALVFCKPIFARKVNAALVASSLAVHGFSGLLAINNNHHSTDDAMEDPITQPGLLKGGYGGQLTLGLAVVSLIMSYMLEHNKIRVPTFWTPMASLDKCVDELFEFGTKII